MLPERVGTKYAPYLVYANGCRRIAFDSSSNCSGVMGRSKNWNGSPSLPKTRTNSCSISMTVPAATTARTPASDPFRYGEAAAHIKIHVLCMLLSFCGALPCFAVSVDCWVSHVSRLHLPKASKTL